MDGLVTCRCGCGAPPKNNRSLYASDRCRARASRERNSPVLTTKQCRTLRSAAYWLLDYSNVLRDGIAPDERPEVREALAKLRVKLDGLAIDLRHMAKGGQLPLRGLSVRTRGARLELGAGNV